MGILVMFLLPLHDQGMCFHFFGFISSSIALLNVLRFSATRSFTFLVTFIPRYLDFWAAMVNGSAFLASLSVSSSLVLRMPSVPWRNFWILLLCQIPWFSLGVFRWRLERLLRTRRCHLRKMTVSLPLFQVGTLSFCRHVWIAVANSPNAMLKKCAESGRPCS